MKRRPRKIITRAIVFLIAGAIVNVACAWTMALLSYPHSRSTCGQWRNQITNTAFDEALWSRHATDSWPAIPQTHAECLHVGARTRGFSVAVMWTGIVRFDETLEEKRDRLRGTGTFQVIRLEWGVPLPCCAMERWQESGSIAVAGIGPHFNDGLKLGGYELPRHVLWLGFAINTIFYAGILWLLFAAPGFIRKWKRIKRGLCPACAYPIGTSDICTECGERVKS